MSEVKTYSCRCGEISGVMCDWEGPAEELVLVEYMPLSLRDQHREARNSGRYPHNGAERMALLEACAISLVSEDDAWSEILGRPSNLLEHANEDAPRACMACLMDLVGTTGSPRVSAREIARERKIANESI